MANSDIISKRKLQGKLHFFHIHKPVKKPVEFIDNILTFNHSTSIFFFNTFFLVK